MLDMLDMQDMQDLIFKDVQLEMDQIEIPSGILPKELLETFKVGLPNGKLVSFKGQALRIYYKEGIAMSAKSDSVISMPREVQEAIQGIGSLPRQILEQLNLELVLRELPRVDSENPDLILYFQKPEHISLNRLTKARAGRYFRRVLPNLNDEQIKQFTANIKGEFTELELEFTKDAERVQDVYMNGPSSCMSGNVAANAYHYKDVLVDGKYIHPMQAFIHPENSLELAYLKTPNGRIIARVWTNKERMLYGTIYASTDTYDNADEVLKQRLIELGYKHDSMQVVYLQKIQKIITDGDAILCPFIDPANVGVTLHEDYLLIAGNEINGKTMYNADHTTGCLEDFNIEEDPAECLHCQQQRHENQMHDVRDCHSDLDEEAVHKVCIGCIHNGHYVYAVISGNSGVWDYAYISSDDAVEIAYSSSFDAEYIHRELEGELFEMDADREYAEMFNH